METGERTAVRRTSIHTSSIVMAGLKKLTEEKTGLLFGGVLPGRSSLFVDSGDVFIYTQYQSRRQITARPTPRQLRLPRPKRAAYPLHELHVLALSSGSLVQMTEITGGAAPAAPVAEVAAEFGRGQGRNKAAVSALAGATQPAKRDSRGI
jgi:hypothetical protein